MHRIVTTADAAGWRPSKGELDKLGREIPDEEYHTPDFEKRLSLRPRSEAIAKHLTNFLQRTNPFDKTIVFCVDQEHADEMRQLLNNLNTDIVKTHPDYVCRVTSDEGKIGKGHLSRFQELETETPVILTTSQLLSTGVDAPMVKNVVLIRVIGTMTEFKQIIGRGTRLREDYGKFYFNILDYTGTATRHFADKEFDGDPEFVTDDEIDADGNTVTTVVVEPEFVPADGDDSGDDSDDQDAFDPSLPVITDVPEIDDPPEPPTEPRKYYVTKGKVTIATHLTQDLDAEGKQLRASEFRDYTSEIVLSLFVDVTEFRQGWADPERRAEILAQLEAKGISPAEASEAFGNLDTDPFDLLCNIAWNAPVITRKERAERMRKNAPSFFEEYGEQARQILDVLLEKYAAHGPGEFAIPDSLKNPPLSHIGNPSELAEQFGGVEPFLDAVAKLQELLYAA